MNKLLLYSLVILFSIAPFVSGVTVNDFFNKLLNRQEETPLVIIDNRAEILDERTERSCNGGTCVWNQYTHKKFNFYEGKFYYFNNFLTSDDISNFDLNYNFLDGTTIKSTPIIEINGIKLNLRDATTDLKNKLDYKQKTFRKRDYTKFEVDINKTTKLNRIGFDITSNKRITYFDYEYKNKSVTDLLIGDLRYSYLDLIKKGFNVSFDKKGNRLWIDLTGRTGKINLDPTINFLGSSNDGQSTTDESTNVCTGVQTGGTTIAIGDNHGSSPAIRNKGVFDFNTSTIPVGVTITDITLSLYADSFTAQTLPTWSFFHSFNQREIATLTCDDFSGLSLEAFTMSGSAGRQNSSYSNTTFLNTTGFTSFILGNNFAGHPPSGRSWLVNIRASEYAGTTNDPVLSVSYTSTPPNIFWVTPTPDDGSIISGDNAFLNATINHTDNLDVVAILDFNRSLVGYWNFESFNTSGIFDNSTYNNFANYEQGSDSLVIGAIYGNGYDFRQSNDGIELNVTDSLSLDINGTEITMMGWYRPIQTQSDNGFRYLFEKRGGGAVNTDAYRLAFFGGATDDWVFRLTTTTGSTNCITSGITINVNQWYHIAARYNGSRMNIWIDGVEEASCSKTGTITTNDFDLIIGGNPSNGVQSINATIDEISLHKRALSINEILAAINASKGLFNNFTNLPDATYEYTAFAINTAGQINKSSQSFIVGAVEVAVGVLKLFPNVLLYPFVKLNLTNDAVSIFPNNLLKTIIQLNESKDNTIFPNDIKYPHVVLNRSSDFR